ncbi:type IV toxin-antitoxin system AbiEi family antitoxin domain-containing protein [Mesorhizobium sp.]|uniref:type IV toxin-antitoxin system AbiEi family antitoxin domain-containing protein n=1 Tax=Mesorhizobium sp. TaxID=1871066 RepID=UPI000FE8F02D|nr:MAG: hypothetical protein EOR75_10445 [Mesorhizobium sp.]TIO84078.1 MAG: hypothetical protein E5X74_17575 [Mesorhizobium sp.]
MIGSVEASQRDFAVSLIERHGIMRLSDLKRRGINPATLARLVDEGILQRPREGYMNVRTPMSTLRIPWPRSQRVFPKA